LGFSLVGLERPEVAFDDIARRLARHQDRR